MRSGSAIAVVSVLLSVVGLLAAVIWFDRRLLADLARTPDSDLLYLTRTGWAGAIVFAFPIGPLLYLTMGKIR
jgi:hypothetical protein